jgi:hypothetical protein
VIKKTYFFKLITFLVLQVAFAACSTPIDVNTSKVIKNKKSSNKTATKPSAPRLYKKAFKDVAEEIGLGDISGVRFYAVDWSGDGHTDLVVLPEHYSIPIFYIYNKISKKFSITKQNLFLKNLRASFLTFADFNKDGMLDIIVATLNQKTELSKHPLRLFVRSKSGYKEVSNAFPQLKMPTASITLIDVNMDGLLDVYASNWYNIKTDKMKLAPDRLFIAQGEGLKFVDTSGMLEGEHKYSDKIKTYVNGGPSFGSSQCDVDQNGYPDILVASSSGYSNKAWFNLKRGKGRVLRNLAKKTGLSADSEGFYAPLSGGNSFYMICSDYNQDGIIDVAVGELFHSYDSETKDRSSILSGSTPSFPPKFIRTEYHKDDGTGSWSQGDRRALWIDLDHDSYMDLIVENSGFPPKSKMIFFKQDSDYSFADSAYDYNIDVINPSGVISLDFNRDGRIDLVAGQHKIRSLSLKTKVFAFQNKMTQKNYQSVKIVLRGKNANYHGLGSSVFFKTNNKSYFQNVEYTQGGLPSQNEEGIWFSFRRDEKPLSIKVRWPFLVKNKVGTSYPLTVNYSLKNVKFDKRTSYLILCDNGKINKSCR